MFIVVLGIVSCNYGPYVLWLPPGPNKLLSTISIGIFHVLVALLLSSYVMCVFTDPGTVPTAWHRMVESDEALAGQHRFCRRSNLYRPLRSHFCSVTRRVVLNMDHFCPWVINTVGFYNRKFFMLFLIYANLTLLASLISLIAFAFGGMWSWGSSEAPGGGTKLWFPGFINNILLVAAMGLDAVMVFFVLVRAAASHMSGLCRTPCAVSCLGRPL